MPRRFYLLDILRGFASLAVVLWHYQHFFFTGPGQLAADFDRRTLPFYPLLSPFYDAGNYAVELFFVLSGFIFYWLYRERVADRAVSGREFFVLRFSRLYPLHLATLLFVAAGQLLFLALNGEYVVYPINDLKHFALNLAFVSHWGLQDGWSFNAPIWSVSVEVLLYALFFLVALWRLPSGLAIPYMMIAGLLVARFTSNSGMGFGLFCFFAGGATYLAYQSWQARSPRYGHRLAAAAASALLTAGLVVVQRGTPFPFSLLLLFGGVFPLLVLTLALVQDCRHGLGKRYRLVGDITYATYLLHFPLQLLIIGCATALAPGIDYRSPQFFFAFFAALIGISIVVYRRFELPAQRYLRRRFDAPSGVRQTAS